MGSDGQGAVLRDVEEDLANQLSKVQLRTTDGDAKTLSEDSIHVVQQLARVQAKHLSFEKDYEKEWNSLKAKYELLYRPLYDERRDCLAKGTEDSGTPGIPNFWLRAFQNSRSLFEMIHSHDEEILGNLVDVSSTWESEEDQLDFTIHFVFKENKFFDNQTLTKTYKMTTQPKNDSNALIDGYDLPCMEHPESALVSTQGTEINWKEGKDITKKTVVRKQKNKRTHETRTVTKVEENPSFFNFFKSYDVPTETQLEEMTERETEELDAVLEIDYDCGVTLREKIIPEAVRWFLGQVDEDEDETDSDLDDADEDDDDDVSSSGPTTRGRAGAPH